MKRINLNDPPKMVHRSTVSKCEGVTPLRKSKNSYFSKSGHKKYHISGASFYFI